MNTLSRLPYPSLRIAVAILGASGGEKTFSLRFSQPSGAVTITSSKTPWKPLAASTLMIPMPLSAILLTSQPKHRVTFSDSGNDKLVTMSLNVDATNKLSGPKFSQPSFDQEKGCWDRLYLLPSRRPATNSSNLGFRTRYP